MPDRYYRDTPEYRRAAFRRRFRRMFIRVNLILSPFWAWLVWRVIHQLVK